MSVAVVDCYLRRRRVRLEISMGRFVRTSDVFNNPRGEFLDGVSVPVEGGSGREEGTQGRAPNAAIRLSEICLVYPVSEPPVPPGGAERRERVPQAVVLEVDDWQVTGTLFLLDRINWADFLASASGRFLPVRAASVRLGDLEDSSLYPFLLVNSSRIGALYSGD